MYIKNIADTLHWLYQLRNNPFKLKLLLRLPQALVIIIKDGKFNEFKWDLLREAKYFFAKYFNRQRFFCSRQPLVIDEVMIVSNPDGFNGMQNYLKQKATYLTPLNESFTCAFLDYRSVLWVSLQKDKTCLYKSMARGDHPQKIHQFQKGIKTIFITRQGTIFIVVPGEVFKSNDLGQTFKKVLDLSAQQSFARECTITENKNGEILLGEYANIKKGDDTWQSVAMIHLTADDGESWIRSDFLMKDGVNKHVHLLKSDAHGNLFLAEGDNKKRLWMNKIKFEAMKDKSSLKLNTGWYKIRKGGLQTGGYIAAVFANSYKLFGTDYSGGTNYIIKTEDNRNFSKKLIPDPYRRNPVYELLLCNSLNKKEIIVASTINQVRLNKSRSAIFFSEDSGNQWTKFLEYQGIEFKMHIITNTRYADPVDWFLISGYKRYAIGADDPTDEVLFTCRIDITDLQIKD